MTHTDDRENVYRKANGRYIPIGKINSPYVYDSFKAEGLWLHTLKDGGGMQSMTLIAKLDELPSSAASFAAVMQHKSELVELIRQSRVASMNDTADDILKWIAGKGKA